MFVHKFSLKTIYVRDRFREGQVKERKSSSNADLFSKSQMGTIMKSKTWSSIQICHRDAGSRCLDPPSAPFPRNISRKLQSGAARSQTDAHLACKSHRRYLNPLCQNVPTPTTLLFKKILIEFLFYHIRRVWIILFYLKIIK